MNALEKNTIRVCSEPEPMSRPLETALAIARNALECDGALTEANLPQGARLALERRAALLEASLAPARPERVRMVLATLAQMPRRIEEDPAKIQFALEVEVSDLSRWPEWALVAACRAYRNNDLGAGPWRPTTAELASFCRSRVEKLYAERSKISAVISAKIAAPIPDEDRERRKEFVRKWRESMTTQEAAKDPGSVSAADARHVFDQNQRAQVSEIIMRDLNSKSEYWRSHAPVASDALLATMGLKRSKAPAPQEPDNTYPQAEGWQ